MTPENLLSEWSRLLVESLADAGLRNVVVSPGSRSTPLAWAFLSCARVRCQSVVDERSAAFFAMGYGRATGVPALLVCTSGSAAANYFPAIVEASLSRTPLIVVTADRPFELLDVSAPQTIDQTKIYGGYVRRFVELGMPDPAPAALVALRRKAAQTLSDALGPEPGPVHLNFRARKPLEPVESGSAAAVEFRARVDQVLSEPVTRSATAARHASPDLAVSVARDCASMRRGIIVCGPAAVTTAPSPSAVSRVVALTGFPVYAEATSQLRFARDGFSRPYLLDGLDLLMRSALFHNDFEPEVVIQIGEPPISGALDRFVALHPNLVRHVLTEHGWPDPHGTARSIVVGNIDKTLKSIGDRLEERSISPDPAWSAALSGANDAAWRAVESVLADEPQLSEGAAIRAVVDALPPGAALSLGNSLPVRHADAFLRQKSTGVTVLGQRGASGIDGVLSATAGAARATGRPTALVNGDVSTLHDLGGFAVAKTVASPLVVVVLNNDGGRIFEQLPWGSSEIEDDKAKFWTTPHGYDFRAVADLFGLRYARPETARALSEAVAGAMATPGCTLIEVVLPVHGARELYAKVGASVDRELRAAATR